MTINRRDCGKGLLGFAALASSGLPFGAFAHMGEVDPASGWPATPVLSPEEYAARAARWLARGATIVGGCCGTGPDHIAALARLSPAREDPFWERLHRRERR